MVKNFVLTDSTNYIYNLNKKTGFLFNKKTGKEFFLNKMGAEILSDILKKKKNKLTPVEENYILRLKAYGLITDVKITDGVYREVQTDIPLQSIQLELSKKCNLKCIHCYIPNYSTKNDMTLNQVKKVIDEASDLGVINFDITGGEPFLRKDILEILEYIHVKGMRTTIFTNGTIISENILQKLKDLNISKLKISIDGYDSKTHDEVRGKGAFKKTIENIVKFKEAGLLIEINTVLHKNNYKMAKKIIEQLERLEVPYHVDRYVPFDGNVYDHLCITDEEYLEAIQGIVETKLSDIVSDSTTQDNGFFCGAGNSYVFIKSNGTVAFCPTMPENFSGGNFKKQSLKEIWENSIFFKRIRNVNCKYFSVCSLSHICKGGCRSRSTLIYGSIDTEDLQSCKLMYNITGIASPPLKKYLEREDDFE
ncbi:radical SAM protein [Enterococcus faecalis]|nr:radical SAM protein [Enterococcus faecalis]